MPKFARWPIPIILVFMWVGFVSAISFMEAWLKFDAAGVTLPIALSIGRLIFTALNRVEWLFAVAIVIYEITGKKYRLSQPFLWVLFLLSLQTFLLLPALNERVEIVLQGKELAPSLLHFYYFSTEVVKVACLFIFGTNLFQEAIFLSRKCFKETA